MKRYFTILLAALALCGNARSGSAELDLTVEPAVVSQAIEGEKTVDSAEPPAAAAATPEPEAAPADTATTVPAAPVSSSVVVSGDSVPYVPHRGADFRIFKSVTNPNVKPYTFLQDQTWTGIPIFLAGIIAKGEKEAFRQNYKNPNTRIRLIKYNFHNEIDNYTQFLPLALTFGLKMGGYEGRSDWPRLLASSASSYAIMALLVNGIKYTASEMRPDGSTRNSWPSGHTATAFAAATILHKEYGLTRSPWFSVGGYAIATATGVMRVLNNRHWISDVLSGAGIGILSTELGYGIMDLLFKKRGLLRNDLEIYPDMRANPSFFNISMGIGLGNRNLNMPAFDFNVPDELIDEGDVEEETALQLKFRMATVVGAEAAWFFSPYVGVGGRLRVKSTPINGWSAFTLNNEEQLRNITNDPVFANTMQNINLTIQSDHITEFAADAGVYFHYPLSSRFALGSKLLIGRSIMNDIEVSADLKGKQLVLNPDGFVNDNEPLFKPGDKDIECHWDYINLSVSNTMKFGTGISLTYAHKNAFSWRVFIDYDVCRKTFKATYAPFKFLPDLIPDYHEALLGYNFDATKPAVSQMRKTLNQWVFGGALCVSF